MRWRKLGRIFAPPAGAEWIASHAAYPTPWPLDERRVRIFFVGRDARKRGCLGYADFDFAASPPALLTVSRQPLLGPGRPGAFDDSGLSIGCLLADGDRLRLYYMGWNQGVTVPFRNAIGLALAEEPDGPFRRYSEGPLLDRSPVDPFSLSYPCVRRIDDGVWRMWYGSHQGPGDSAATMRHVIKDAESPDGLRWTPTGRVRLDLRPGEFGLSRPCVLPEADGYRMWYAIRDAEYRIGTAVSDDGLTWRRRDDEAGVAPSAEGWDSEAVTYPWVFDHAGARYMLYNGNGYGRTGFGVAVMEAP